MSVKVGLVTEMGAPISAARPLTNCVFPAPSGPTRATTVPGGRLRATLRPALSVSAGLAEVQVTTRQFSILDFRFSIEAADSGESDVGEFLCPARWQLPGI